MGLFRKKLKNERHRALVIGLDGVPFTLLENLKNQSHIPNMGSMFEEGYFGQMSVSIPEISSVSWSSFMTGVQSGRHGIYGFIDLEPRTYKMYFPNFTHLQVPAMWDDLALRGKKAVVLNMPATYPARKINGVLVSGFVAVDINKAVYPPSYLPVLSDMGYRIDLDTTKAKQDYEFMFRDLDATLNGRTSAVDFFWQEVDWDLFIVVITGTDRLMHFLWTAYEDRHHPYHHAFLDYFNKVDTFVGRIFDRFLTLERSEDGTNRLYMLSDHGFTKIETEVYLNRWLQEEGYLKFQTDLPETIMDIGPGSVAFAMDPSRIYINRKNKYPLGTVEDRDYEKVRQELKEALEKLTFDDGKVIAKKLYLSEELYKGPHFDRAPDLVMLSHPGYDLKGKASSPRVFGRTNLMGMHSQDDAFFFSSEGIKCDSIFDVAEIILKPLLAK